MGGSARLSRYCIVMTGRTDIAPGISTLLMPFHVCTSNDLLTLDVMPCTWQPRQGHLNSCSASTQRRCAKTASSAVSLTASSACERTSVKYSEDLRHGSGARPAAATAVSHAGETSTCAKGQLLKNRNPDQCDSRPAGAVLIESMPTSMCSCKKLSTLAETAWQMSSSTCCYSSTP